METNLSRNLTACTLAALALAAASTGASASPHGRTFAPHSDQVVQVNVNVNTVVPLADLGDQSVTGAQRRSREMMYRQAREECQVLEATIAATCHLNSINVSAQLRDHRNQQPPNLYINGNYRFTITLKER